MRRGSGAGAIASLTLTCVFGVALLLSLVTGAGVYRRVADRVEQSSAERVGLTYITAKLRAYDAAELIDIGRFGDSDALYLYEDDGQYETVLYVYDGYLRELLCQVGNEPGPEAGQPIAGAQSMELSRQVTAGTLLALRYTEADGTVREADVCLRSGG